MSGVELRVLVLSFIILSSSPNNLGAIIALCVVGIIWGIQQYLVLKNYTLKINSTWVLVSAAGIIASLYVAQFVFAVLDKNLGWAVIGAVGAIFLYFVLRQHFLRASSWILANGVCVAISVATGEIVFRVVSKAIESPVTGSGGGLSALAEATSVLIYSSLVTGVVALAIYRAITGGTLVWLLRHPRRK
ncbi:hypothetical protein FM036_42770 [Nostoc sp. HG1]|nr:hypothetical protein [Nostoc sp. HG1]